MATNEHKERIDKGGEGRSVLVQRFTERVNSPRAGNVVESPFFVFFAFSCGQSNSGI